MKLSPRDQIILAVVLIVLFAGAIFVLGILPRFGELTEAKAQQLTLEQDLQTTEALLKRRQDAKERAAATQVQLLDVSSRFPEAPELPALIIELQDAANEVEIEFIQVTPQEPTAHGEFQVDVIPVGLQIEGTWQQYIEFMEELAGLRREIRIVNLTVSAVPPAVAEVVAPSPEEDDVQAGEDFDEGFDEEEFLEDDVYTIVAQVNFVAYMMPAQLSAPAEAPSAPAGE